MRCARLLSLGLILAGTLGAGRAPQDRPIHVAIIWHQHQPLYLDPTTDALGAPWVRTHATKDYFDMAAMHARHPKIHATINLTSSLLVQLEDYYVARLGPFVSDDGIDAEGFLSRWRGRTDPWIDLALLPDASWPDDGADRVIGDGWSAMSVSPVILARWPDYLALSKRPRADLGQGDLRSVLAHFYAANFDPDFLTGPVVLPADGGVVDLSDVVEERPPGVFRFRRPPDLALTQRLVSDAVRVMQAVVPQHRALAYDPATGRGQVELITTPFYHPILPLLVDSQLARVAQPDADLPSAFRWPEDAVLQVGMGVRLFERLFGRRPSGFWPAEGSVAEAVVGPFAASGALWIATDQRVHTRSSDRPLVGPSRIDEGNEAGTAQGERSLAVFFRDTDLSDRIGFRYQDGPADGVASAQDFLDGVRESATAAGGRTTDVLITVILDGENAWEWYRNDNDGKNFLSALYRELAIAQDTGEMVTVTPSEYIVGNPARGIRPHPVSELPELEPLWPGSWIDASYATWIGETEENAAWEALSVVRADLAQSGLPPPDPRMPPPAPGEEGYASSKAWEAMLAAEGSDWFWWYGADQETSTGDGPFDETFCSLLEAVGSWGRRAGAVMPERHFDGFLLPAGGTTGAGGAMARARSEVLFTVDVRSVEVADAIYIAGGHPALATWRPNTLALRDDGTDGDRRAGDGIWSLRRWLPIGDTIEYKYTNSGPQGYWTGEEFANANRSVHIPNGALEIADVFGETPKED